MQLIGRIGAEPVMKQTKNGKDFLIYKVATTDAGIAPKDGGKLQHSSSNSTRLFLLSNLLRFFERAALRCHALSALVRR
jgi:single-stranded DNA-binding protein